MPRRSEGVLLDTHVWLWFVSGQELQIETCERISRAGDTSCLFVSAISAWELGMLAAKGRIEIEGGDCLAWVARSLREMNAHCIAVEPAVAVKSSFLVGDFHGDPADRIIAATAMDRGLELLTRDQRILDWTAHSDAIAATRV